MLETFLEIRWIDVLDITIVAFIIYQIMVLVKGTRAQQMLWGLAILLIVFFPLSVEWTRHAALGFKYILEFNNNNNNCNIST